MVCGRDDGSLWLWLRPGLLRWAAARGSAAGDEVAGAAPPGAVSKVRLTTRGHRRAREARAARDTVVTDATTEVSAAQAQTLEALLDKMVSARVASRLERRRAGFIWSSCVPRLFNRKASSLDLITGGERR